MRFMKKPWAVACLCCVTISGVGIAADQGASTTTATTSTPHEVSGGEELSLSPQEMLVRVRVVIPEMEGHTRTVNLQLVFSKKKRDVVKVLCLDDKVRQMKLATGTAKDRVVDLTSAVTQNDVDRSRHEYTVIQVLRERVQTLVAESQQCIGEDTGFVGDAKVLVTIDPSLPDTDPSAYEDDTTTTSDPPVLSSPTM
jgi:hypothetical protein